MSFFSEEIHFFLKKNVPTNKIFVFYLINFQYQSIKLTTYFEIFFYASPKMSYPALGDERKRPRENRVGQARQIADVKGKNASCVCTHCTRVAGNCPSGKSFVIDVGESKTVYYYNYIYIYINAYVIQWYLYEYRVVIP